LAAQKDAQTRTTASLRSFMPAASVDRRKCALRHAKPAAGRPQPVSAALSQFGGGHPRAQADTYAQGCFAWRHNPEHAGIASRWANLEDSGEGAAIRSA